MGTMGSCSEVPLAICNGEWLLVRVSISLLGPGVYNAVKIILTTFFTVYVTGGASRLAICTASV